MVIQSLQATEKTKPMTPHNFKQLARQLKALSNENRLALYLEIVEHDRLSIPPQKCLCLISDIAAKLKIGAPTVSHHVKVLEQAGLIHVQKQGKFITAAINHDAREAAMRAFKVTQL
jgi:ArsR family transcriptional regulator